jgi:hypothetical protein
LQTLNNLKRRVTLKDEALIYIVNYQRIYKSVKGNQKRDNDRYIAVSGQAKSHVATN